jgi:pilus assembly protein CpaF
MWQIRKPVRERGPEEEERRRRALEEHRLVTLGDASAFAKRDKHTELKVELHQRLIELINLQALEKMSRQQIESEIGEIVAEELATKNEALNQNERKQLVSDILDELLGLGPVEPLLKDPTITDILVNGHNQVFVERYGILEPSAVRFKDEKHLLRIIQKIVSAVGRRIDESSPMVDARLADGSRVNAVLPPLRSRKSSKRSSEAGSTFSSRAVRARARRLCSPPCRHSSTAASGSSRSRTRPNFNFSSGTS